MAQPTTAKFSQQIVEIEEVRDGVIILKNGALRQILMVAGVNFDLKSEEEQNLILYGYQNLLNALDFSLQFFIHSRKINLDRYLEKLSTRQQEEQNELLKNQIGEYRQFVSSFITENPIMNKTFFVIIPFDPIQIPQIAAGIAAKIMGLFGKKTSPQATQQEKEQQIAKGLVQLGQRVKQVVSALGAIGLNAIALDTASVTELFYNLYNPETIEKKGVLENNPKS